MIYPKEYSTSVSDIKENTAFVMMPFRRDLDNIYGEIKQTCIELDIICHRADELGVSKFILEGIMEGICKSEILIIDLTTQNPNVFYEMGIVHSLRDKEAVIMIQQNDNNFPVDIQPWSVLQYDPRNLFKFKNDLQERMKSSRKSVRRNDFIRQFLRRSEVKENEIKLFIEVGYRLSDDKLNSLYEILTAKYDFEKSSENYLSQLLIYFAQLEDFQDGIIRRAAAITKIHVFSSDGLVNKFASISKKLLVKSQHHLIHLDDVETFDVITDYCIRLINIGKLKSEAISWLIEYLHNYRMGRIDIVRSKIQRFLMESQDDDVNQAILSMLEFEKPAIRECAADICGQKKLKPASQILINRLRIETNPHAVRSYITALTKLNCEKAVPYIYDWMINNKDKWGNQAVSASLKKIALTAFKELDESNTYLGKLAKTTG